MQQTRGNRQQTKAKLTRKTDCWVLFLCLSSLLCFLLSSFRSNHKNKYPQTVSESFELRNIRIRTQWKYFVASDADETRASVTRDGYRHGQYKRSTGDCGLRTRDCGVGISLRADEIKLWLTPSAKQRRNPCSGLPAVYPDLSTRHDWPVKKGLCFVCRDRQSGWRGIRNALPVIRWVRWGSRTRISALLRRRY